MSHSEIKRITTRAAQRCREGRDEPHRRRDDAFVVDLIYLLEESVKIIDMLKGVAPASSDEVLTVAKLGEILDAIEDPDLKQFFTRRVARGLGVAEAHDGARIGRG